MGESTSLRQFFDICQREANVTASCVGPDMSRKQKLTIATGMLGKFEPLLSTRLNVFVRLCTLCIVRSLQKSVKNLTVEQSQSLQAGVSGEAKQKGLF